MNVKGRCVILSRGFVAPPNACEGSRDRVPDGQFGSGSKRTTYAPETPLAPRQPVIIADIIPLHAPIFDRINRRTYRRRGVLRQFETASGWIESGERVAIGLVAELVRGAAILDIGVGGGRTAPLMADISANYRG